MSEGKMKRTSLFLDQALLKQVMRALGVTTYSEAVNLSLTETLRIKKVQALPNFFGKGLWEGDLSKMRQDRPR
jgi:Arc/MetJ family transcription regulator